MKGNMELLDVAWGHSIKAAQQKIPPAIEKAKTALKEGKLFINKIWLGSNRQVSQTEIQIFSILLAKASVNPSPIPI